MRSWTPGFLAAGWIILAVGCTPRSEAPSPGEVVFGKTTRAELMAHYGSPVRSYSPSGRPAAEVQVFSRSDSFQLEEGKVVAHFREPSAKSAEQDERSLQYWRHLWRGRNPSFEEIPGTRDPHGKSLFVLKDADGRRAVVYDSSRGEVIRVLQYGN